MKKILLILLLSLFSYSGYSQNPQNVELFASTDSVFLQGKPRELLIRIIVNDKCYLDTLATIPISFYIKDYPEGKYLVTLNNDEGSKFFKFILKRTN